MAVDIFLKLDGVKGESVDKAHAGEIEVLSWSWGLTQPVSSASAAGGASVGKVNVQDLSLTKYVDLASPNLISADCIGQPFKEASLTVRKAGGISPIEYLKVSLKDVHITSYATGGSGGQERQTEKINLHFNEFKVEYFPQNPNGSAGAPTTAGFNILRNAKV